MELSYWGATKPPAGTQLNRAHRLTRGLAGLWTFAENAGGAALDSARGLAVPLQGSADWAGKGLRCDASGEGATLFTPTQLQISTPITLACRFTVLAAPDNNAAFFGVTHNNTDAPPYVSYELVVDGSGHFQLFANNGSASTLASSQLVSSYLGSSVTFVGVWNNEAIRLYLNGELDTATAGLSPGPAYGPTTTLGIGCYPSVMTRVARVIVETALIAQATWTLDDVKAFQAEPYQMFEAPIWRRYYVSAGVTVTPGAVALSSSAPAPLAVANALPGLASLVAGIQAATPALQATPAATFLGLAEPAPKPIIQVLPPAVAAAVALPAATPVRQALPAVVGLGLAAPAAIPNVVVLPGAVALAVGLPAVTVAIVGDVTATPAAVALAAGLPAATPIVQARPAAVALTRAQPAVAPAVQALPAPLAIGLALPAAFASGQVDDPIALDLTDEANVDDPIALDLTDEVAVGNVIATPGAVSLSAALPAITPRLAPLPALVAVSTAEPAAIPSLQALPAAAGLSASPLTATPALSPLPAAVALATATPALLAVVIRALPFGPGLAITTLSPTSSSGTTVVPGLVTLALALPAALPVLRVQPGLVALSLPAVIPQGQLVVFPALVGLLLATPAALGAKGAVPAVVALLVLVRQPTTIGYGGGGQAGAGISYESSAAPLEPRYQAQSDPLRRISYESTADALR